MDKVRRKTAVAMLSVISNSLLVALKLAVGLRIGSVAVVSEAIHSAVDLVAAGVALFAVRRSGKPSDNEHPFGHGKLENLSGTIEAFLIFVAAVWIVIEAVRKLIQPRAIESVGWGIGVMLLSSVVNMAVSHVLFKVGRQTHSAALMADGWHLRTDVWTAAGVMVGLSLIGVGETIFKGMHFHWIDPVAAIIVALLILRAAYRLTMESGRDLLDARLPDDEEREVRQAIERHSDNFREYHDLRTRRGGETRFVEFHLLVDPGMSVEASHTLADQIVDDIAARFPGSDVNIHVEPFHLRRQPNDSPAAAVIEADPASPRPGS